MKHGFTLLELSIVLVIIGLIIGGITVGADMIRSAELSNVASDVSKFKTAINTFKLKYNALPGDIKNASSYWPTECVDGGSSFCDGNGNGNFSNSANNVGYLEGARAWQHMSLAGVISGSYNGLFAGATIGDTYPKSAIAGMAYQLHRIGTASSCNGAGGAALYGIDNIDAIQFGAKPSGSTCLYDGILSVLDAQTIDTKIDDGQADKGKVLGVNAYNTTGCAGTWSNSVTSGSYDLSSSTNNCRLVFLKDW